MSEDLFEEKLAHFKENEKPEAVLLVADEPNLINIVISWTNMKVMRAKKLRCLRGDSESEVWEWLWRNAIYSRKELIAKSSLPEHGFDRKMIPLIGNRVLYPDGTVNSFVQRYLRDRVMKLFDAKPKKPRKK